MRGLIALGLTICAATSAAAQTEVIIRRPGEKDQVIHLDSARTREAFTKARVELEKATTAIQQHMKQTQERLGEMRLKELTAEPTRTNTLALRKGELAAETLIAPLMKGYATMLRQPHLGVVVATTPRESDKYGAYIQAVTPGSPADKAGIVSGDIITRIAGKSLIEKDPKDDSGPGVRLISIIGTLTVGKPVDVELRRGTQNKTVKVTPNDEDLMTRIAPSIAEISRIPGDRMAPSIAFGGDLPSRVTVPGFNAFTGPNGTFSYSFGNNGLFASYELAPVNEKLGSYFGVTEGVLVVSNRVFEERAMAAPAVRADSMRAGGRAGGVGGGRMLPRDTGVARAGSLACDSTVASTGSTIRCRGTGGAGTITYLNGTPGALVRRAAPVNIGLEPGDVIVSVDGRKVNNPGQLMRIVGSYERNDEFKLQIMRQKRAETLTVKMP